MIDGLRLLLLRREDLIADLIPRYFEAGKSYLAVAFGCTGGRHRSVAAATMLAERLRARGFSPNIRHRDLSLKPSDSVEEHPAPSLERDNEP